jgi:cell division protein FtsI/penicillin-binding protein 2
MSLYAQKKAKRRTVLLSFFLLFWTSVLCLRLVKLQIFEYPRLRTRVLDQNSDRQPIIPKRGTIFDRRGIILARSIPRKSVYYSPFKDVDGEEHKTAIRRLRPILNLSPSEVADIRGRIDQGKSFIWIKRKIDPEQERAVAALDLEGVGLLEENKRFYPQGRLAPHLLGGVNIDDKGDSGVELKYNSILEGERGERLVLTDAHRRDYRFETLKAPRDGKDLVLTIDETIQYIAQKELEKAALDRKAGWGVAVISVPHTGEILALANYPDFDPNHPPSSLTLTDRIRAIHQQLDPGSTFKIVTASAALESGAVDLDETFDCSAQVIQVGRKTYHDHTRLGVLSFRDVLVHSSNVGTIQAAGKIGEQTLYDTIQRFGFGSRTGIDLPAEEKGLIRPPGQWTKYSRPSLSIGYEISVTPMQLLQMVNIIANTGLYVSPRIVREVRSQRISLDYEEPREVLTARTAAVIRSVMEDVVLAGTGTEAHVEGYSIAGKTGTAQKYIPELGTYSASAHTALFVGFASADRPLFSMIIVIDDPEGPYYGGQVAAPVFREIAKKLFRYMEIKPREKRMDTIIASRRAAEVSR